jgi:hypothetical protein
MLVGESLSETDGKPPLPSRLPPGRLRRLSRSPGRRCRRNWRSWRAHPAKPAVGRGGVSRPRFMGNGGRRRRAKGDAARLGRGLSAPTSEEGVVRRWVVTRPHGRVLGLLDPIWAGWA